MFVDPAVTNAVLDLRVDPALRKKLPRVANGRVLVVDYWLGRQRALIIGDLEVGLEASPCDPRYAALDPIEGVQVLVALPLLPMLQGATLCWNELALRNHLRVRLPRPEEWIEFLERHPPRGR